MNDSTGFQMTVAEYFTPLGRNIDKKDKVIISLIVKMNVIPLAFKSSLKCSMVDSSGDSRGVSGMG